MLQITINNAQVRVLPVGNLGFLVLGFGEGVIREASLMTAVRFQLGAIRATLRNSNFVDSETGGSTVVDGGRREAGTTARERGTRIRFASRWRDGS